MATSYLDSNCVAWMGSLPSSLKLVLRVQPSDVVLSVIDSEQSPCLSLPLWMSIQTEITDAMCSNKLFEALPCSSFGM